MSWDLVDLESDQCRNYNLKKLCAIFFTLRLKLNLIDFKC